MTNTKGSKWQLQMKHRKIVNRSTELTTKSKIVIRKFYPLTSPHRSRIRCSTLTKNSLSTRIPIMIITIITAMTWLMSFSSRPIIIRCPNPKHTINNSAAMSERQAKDQPCFIPVIICGRAAGIITSKYKFHRFAPMVLAARI